MGKEKPEWVDVEAAAEMIAEFAGMGPVIPVAEDERSIGAIYAATPVAGSSADEGGDISMGEPPPLRSAIIAGEKGINSVL